MNVSISGRFSHTDEIMKQNLFETLPVRKCFVIHIYIQTNYLYKAASRAYKLPLLKAGHTTHFYNMYTLNI